MSIGFLPSGWSFFILRPLSLHLIMKYFLVTSATQTSLTEVSESISSDRSTTSVSIILSVFPSSAVYAHGHGYMALTVLSSSAAVFEKSRRPIDLSSLPEYVLSESS